MATARAQRTWQDMRATRDGEGYARLAAWALIAVLLAGVVLLTVGTAQSPPSIEDVAQLTQAP